MFVVRDNIAQTQNATAATLNFELTLASFIACPSDSKQLDRNERRDLEEKNYEKFVNSVVSSALRLPFVMLDDT